MFITFVAIECLSSLAMKLFPGSTKIRDQSLASS